MRGYLGSIVGAVGLSLVTSVYHWIFFRPALSDGQYGMVWMFTLPAGAILGAVTAHACAASHQRPAVAGVDCLIASGVVGVPLSFYVLMTGTNSANPGTTSIASFLESLFFAAPTILWVAVLLLWSFRLFQRKSS